MIGGKRVVALVPARGGSKGIPGKNLYRIGEKSLVERAVDLARASGFVDQVYVSSDDAAVHALAQKLDAAPPEPRPAHLASDGARTIELVHYMVETGQLDRDNLLLLLQPTTPLRNVQHAKELAERFAEAGEAPDGIISVVTAGGNHPLKAQIINNGYLAPLNAQDSSVPRQSLRPAFFPNGAFYLARVDVLLDQDTFVPRRTLAYEMDELSSVNLDGKLDLLLLETILSKGLVQMEDGSNDLRPPAVTGKGETA
ncbi:MAG: hypothetical protein JJ969_05495 [Rhizobiaceae bacterium]|nr:hypothetical protein [Rhizobiaceae bacterium]